MIDPYRMIVINLIAVIFLVIFLLLFKIFFPNKKINYGYLLLGVSILPLISILRKGTYESGDFSLHVKFAMQFYENITQGNLFPEWIARHCSGYGCPMYIFMFALPYYLISFFHFLGFSFISSLKIYLITTYIASGFGMFLWIKNEINERAAFVAAIFYLYAPYHLIDLHFRVSIGELLSMSLMPYAFFIIKKLTETGKYYYFLLSSVIFALMIITHQVTSFVCFPLLLIYSILVARRENKINFKKIKISFLSLLVGMCISIYYWLPLLMESKLIEYKVIDALEFHPLSSFLYSPDRFGLLFQGHMGQLYLNVGYAQWIIIAISIHLIIKNKVSGTSKQLLIFSLSLFLISFFMMQKISLPIWVRFSFLKNFQFSWRLMVEVVFLVSIMAGVVSSKIKKEVILFILISFTIMYTILNWGNRKVIPATDSKLRSEKLFGEYPGGVDLTTPIWVDINKSWVGTWPTKDIEILTGKANVIQIKNLQTHHEYILDVLENSVVKTNVYYYPGWKLTINNKDAPISFTNKSYPGVITFNLNKGIYFVNLDFTDTPDRAITKIISILSALSLVFFFIFKKLGLKKD